MPGADAGRVFVLQGPVAVHYSNRMDQSVVEITSEILRAYRKELLKEMMIMKKKKKKKATTTRRRRGEASTGIATIFDTRSFEYDTHARCRYDEQIGGGAEQEMGLKTSSPHPRSSYSSISGPSGISLFVDGDGGEDNGAVTLEFVRRNGESDAKWLSRICGLSGRSDKCSSSSRGGGSGGDDDHNGSDGVAYARGKGTWLSALLLSKEIVRKDNDDDDDGDDDDNDNDTGVGGGRWLPNAVSALFCPKKPKHAAVASFREQKEEDKGEDKGEVEGRRDTVPATWSRQRAVVTLMASSGMNAGIPQCLELFDDDYQYQYNAATNNDATSACNKVPAVKAEVCEKTGDAVVTVTDLVPHISSSSSSLVSTASTSTSISTSTSTSATPVPFTLRYGVDRSRSAVPLRDRRRHNDASIKRLYASMWGIDLLGGTRDDAGNVDNVASSEREEGGGERKVESHEFDVTERAIQAFVRSIRGRGGKDDDNEGSKMMSVSSSSSSPSSLSVGAPIDFSIVAAWRSLVRCLFSGAVQGNILDLVHLR